LIDELDQNLDEAACKKLESILKENFANRIQFFFSSNRLYFANFKGIKIFNVSMDRDQSILKPILLKDLTLLYNQSSQSINMPDNQNSINDAQLVAKRRKTTDAQLVAKRRKTIDAQLVAKRRKTTDDKVPDVGHFSRKSTKIHDSQLVTKTQPEIEDRNVSEPAVNLPEIKVTQNPGDFIFSDKAEANITRKLPSPSPSPKDQLPLPGKLRHMRAK